MARKEGNCLEHHSPGTETRDEAGRGEAASIEPGTDTLNYPRKWESHLLA